MLLQNRGRVVSKPELLEAVWPDVQTTPGSLSRGISLARAALGERGADAEGMIQTVRGRGYRIAAPVTVVGAADGVGTAFVGRRRDLDVLHAGLDRAREGRAGAVFVSGPAGIGKSSLLDEFAGQAQVRGALALWSSCYEGEGGPGFWSWTQLVEALLRSRGAEEIDAQLGVSLDALAFHCAALSPDRGLAGPDRGEQFGLVARLVTSLAERQPLVLVFDDVHWADDDSLALLRFVASGARQLPLLVLSAHRPGEAPPSWTETASYCGRVLGWTESRPLEGLSREESGELVLSVAGERLDDAALDVLYERTAGQPFFVRELARYGGAGGSAVPDTVRQAVDLRLGRLAEDTVSLLRLGAVAGREFSSELIAVASRAPSAAVRRALNDAVDASVLQAREGGERYRFEHALVWEAVYESIPVQELRSAHGTVARSLERLAVSDAAAPVEELARHFRVAGELDEAARYFELSARRAAATAAFDLAVDQYQEVLRILERSGEPDPRQRCELLIALGDAHFCAGDLEAAEQTGWQAVELAREIGAYDLLVQVAEGLAYRRQGNYESVPAERIALLEEALGAVGDSDLVLRARVLCGLSVDLYWSEFERSGALSLDALSAARRSGDRPVLLTALDQRYQHVQAAEHDDERRAINTEMLELSHAERDLEFEFFTRKHRFHEFARQAQSSAVDAELGAMTKLAEGAGRAVLNEELRIARAARALWRGELAEAEQWMTPPEELAGGSGEVAFFAYVPQLFVLRRMTGGLEALEPLVREGVRRFPLFPAFRSGLAFCLAEIGREGEARGILDEISVDDFVGLPKMKDYPVNLGVVAESCARVGTDAEREELYRRLQPHRGQHLVTDTIVSFGSADRYLGLLADALGSGRQAREHLEDAVAIEERFGARPWESYARRDLAAVLERVGLNGEARRLHDHAQRQADELGISLGQRE